MWIFIRHIPESTTRSELRRLVEESLGGRLRLPLLNHRPRLRQVEILQLLDRETGETECHGLVRVEPEKSGHELIKRLNMRRLKGARVRAHRYVRRSWVRDRRSYRDPAADEIDLDSDRRAGDRRRYHLVTSRRSEPRVHSMDQFRREYT